MKSTTRLDSAVFHLTPTRTRCDLIIIANGKKEKIASGLLTPFLAHLKAAQDQTEKGGYSISLEPDPDDEATWFTKGTVERFVRFVSNPDILERVYTLELEILQIEEAIAIQRSNDTGQSTVEEHEKTTRGGEGHKLKPELGEEKAIVLYTPGVYQQPQTNCETPPEEVNSRVQLLKVLETRKTVIQKEQGMAFARAVAAGYEIDNIPPLVSFAKCYGASRLMDACIRFTDLWKKKHENGQWLEIEAAQSMLISSPVNNSSGIVLSSSVSREIDLNGDSASPNNQKPQVESSPGERGAHVPVGQQEYFQGQFPNQMYPTWPIHSPPGMMPMYPAYPVQGMPYYQGFPGNMPFYQPPHPQMDVSPNAGEKRQPLDGGDRNQNSGSSTSKSSSSPDDLELDNKEASQKSQKRSGRSRKDKLGVVVIRNINYIASEAKSSTPESSTDSEADDDYVHDSKPSQRNGSHSRSISKSNNDYEENPVVNQNDYGNWNAFQGFLLSGADEEAHRKDLNTIENGANMKRRSKRDSVDDPLATNGRDPSDIHDRRSRDVHESNGKFSHKFRVSNDAITSSATGSDNARAHNNETNMHFTEANGRNVISRSSNDNFLGENRDQFSYSSDPLAVNGFERAKYRLDAVSSNEIGDESFIVPFRSSSSIQVGPEDRRTAMDMDSEHPSAHQKPEENKIRKELGYYEADDLNLIPERGTERRSIGYDPALDYEMQDYAEGSVRKSQNAAKVANDAKKGTSRLDRSRNPKATSESMSKRTTGGPIRKLKPSKMSPLEDARARADKLRAFKADIQKLKKEQDDADLKRLEALKLERQKRIASRNNSSSGNTTAPLPLMKKPPPKLSPITNRGSKFSDSEIGSSSPLQRSKVRVSVGSIESREASTSMKPNEANRLSKSVSSLPQLKKESSSTGPESKASSVRVRRLSEPKPVVAPHSEQAENLKSSSVRVRRLSEPKPVAPHSVQAQNLKSDGPDSKKISAIINLDKSKAASLPELKIRTPPRGNSNSAQKKMTGNDVIKSNQAKPSATSDNSDSYLDNEVDDNPIIDKTVVVLENDKPSIPAVQGSRNFQYESTSIHAQPSSNHVLHSESKPDLLQDKSIFHEVRTYEADSSRFSDIKPTEVMTYNPPFARISSLEEPSPTSAGTVSTAKVFISAEKAQRADSIPEVSDKIQVKESPKGFRRLLKFGKKNHNSSSSTSFDESSEPVTSDNNGKAISNEVHTVKNLILEDETPPPVAGSSSKSSRHFSLLSPFRSKAASEKRS